eukprot:IDg5813t1
MWLHRKPVLHIIDAGTSFSAAKFVPKEDAETIWNTFLSAWANIYIGYPDSITSDHGSVFVSNFWRSACDRAKINLRSTGIESHNSLGKGETYHSLLRRVYNKAKMEHPSLSDELVLSLSVKAMNDTAGPGGLVPTLLAFGALPKTIEVFSEYPSQTERFRAMETARAEFQMEQPVYVYREKLKQWTGPHLVIHCEKKTVLVDLGKREGASSYNIAQGKEIRRRQEKEILSLIERGTFKIVLREEAGENPNIIPCRFVLSIKNLGTDEELLKA